MLRRRLQNSEMAELHYRGCVYTRTRSSPLTRKLFRGRPKLPVAGSKDLAKLVSSGDGQRRMPFASGGAGTTAWVVLTKSFSSRSISAVAKIKKAWHDQGKSRLRQTSKAQITTP